MTIDIPPINIDIPQMTLLSWLVVGAIAGSLASAISGTRGGGLWMVLVGIVGAIVGGWLAVDVFHVEGVTGVNVTSIVVAVIGALLLIGIFGGIAGGYRYRRL